MTLPEFDEITTALYIAIGRVAFQGAILESYAESLLGDVDPTWRPTGRAPKLMPTDQVTDRILKRANAFPEHARRIQDVATKVRNVQQRRNLVIHSTWTPLRGGNRWRSDKRTKARGGRWVSQTLTLEQIHDIAAECLALRDEILELLNDLLADS